ncbi:MAG: CARDB domain-containing protein [Candidatus Micrarchaeota archaeon]
MAATYTSKLTPSASDGPATIFIPRGAAGDMPQEIYSCPGKFNFQTQVDSTFANSGFSAISSYPYSTQRACPNLLYSNGLGCSDPNLWASPSSSMPVQWSADSGLISTLKLLPRSSTRVYEGSAYQTIQTAGQNINVDYYPIFNNPQNYPSQKGEASLLCTGGEYASLNLAPLTSGTGTSPIPITGHPPAATNWNLQRFTTEGTYTLSSGFNSNECLGSIHILPDYSADTYDTKYHFADNTGTSALDPGPLSYTIHIVDPKTCEVDATISPQSIGISDLTPATDYDFTIHISNPSNLFGMVATGVSVSDPSSGWSARKGANPNGFDTPIPPQGAGSLSIIATSPNPLNNVNEVCFDTTLESDVPFCNGQICTTTVRTCVQLSPQLSCEVQTDSTTDPKNRLLPGEDLHMNVICYNQGTPTACPQLTWTASGFGADEQVSLTEAPPSIQPDAPPFSPPTLPRQITTTAAAPEADLWTYVNPPDAVSTPETSNGNVVVSGNGYDCSVAGSSEPITVVSDKLPDYVPILQTRLISGSPKTNDEVYQITWGVQNTGSGPATAVSLANIKIAPASQDSKLVTPLAPGEQKTWARNFACPSPGIFPLHVVVDSTDAIEEEPPNGELNNEANAQINCGNVLACADLI